VSSSPPAPAARPRRRARRLLFGGVAIALTLVGSLVALEVGLRLFWGGFYLKPTGEHNRHSPTREWENTPSYRGTFEDPEFVMQITHDSHGFRGPEVPAEKPPGRTRVLVLGDSMTYGIGVDDDETFSARLGALDPRLEVVNAGVNGYGTHQELLLLQEVGLPLRPDVVVVCVFFNDIGNSYHRREIGYSLRDGVLVYEPSPALATPKRRRAPGPLRHSYAYRLLSDRLRALKYGLRQAAGARDAQEDLLNNDMSEPAWALHLALLDELVRVATAGGAKVLVVALPESAEIVPESHVAGLPAEVRIYPRLAAWGAARAVPVLDLAPALREAAARGQGGLFYPIDRHLVPEGHAAIAPVLAKALVDLGWVR
jgi:hypothetical protein